ncbi:YetF domain-containing protein [Spirosoma linguale]|uniref:YetF C-terminal domain-containing protein n=1 Tax=Spirosoma linguale (strain ATCC 33905 / DSM 74 / LMG 10896 / Claus 1) TaxID=504472 RepID=D2QE14_SPILD|nr:protein of unknown function DUF421 [Spirosoma linguale DSM 74]
MKSEQIHLEDWQRILFGNNPPEFLLEVFIRSVLILLAFLVTVRLLGKRMNGQLTVTEMAVMVSLGAIISPIMQLPDRGIFLGLVVLVCALFFQRGLTWLDFKSKRVEEVTQGTESLLIEDGVLKLDAMADARISKQQLFATLRSEKIYNVTKVTRLYMEACGIFSIYTEEEEKPGLSSLPDTDKEIHSIQPAADPAIVACMNCGNTIRVEEEDEPCPVCQEVEWTQAVC